MHSLVTTTTTKKPALFSSYSFCFESFALASVCYEWPICITNFNVWLIIKIRSAEWKRAWRNGRHHSIAFTVSKQFIPFIWFRLLSKTVFTMNCSFVLFIQVIHLLSFVLFRSIGSLHAHRYFAYQMEKLSWKYANKIRAIEILFTNFST